MYTEVYNKPYNRKIKSVLDVIEVEKFIYNWNEQTRTLTGFSCPYSPRDICTYILAEGFETTERYIEYSQLLHGKNVRINVTVKEIQPNHNIIRFFKTINFELLLKQECWKSVIEDTTEKITNISEKENVINIDKFKRIILGDRQRA